MDIKAVESMDWEQSSLKNPLSHMEKFDANSNETHPAASTSPELGQNHSDSEVSQLDRAGCTENSRSPSPSLNSNVPSNQSSAECLTPMNLSKPTSKNLGPHAVSSILNSGNASPTSSIYRPVPSIPSSGLPTMIPINLVKSEPSTVETRLDILPDSHPAKPTPAGTTPKGKTTKSGSKKSFVWRYFNHPKMEDGSADKTRTQCLLCNNQLAFNASGTTTTMLNHLKSRHSDVADSEEMRRRQTKIPNSNQNSAKTGGGKSSKGGLVNGIDKLGSNGNGLDSPWATTVDGSGSKASASRKKPDVIKSLLKDEETRSLQSAQNQKPSPLEDSYVQDSAVELTTNAVGSLIAGNNSAKLKGLSLTNFLPPTSSQLSAISTDGYLFGNQTVNSLEMNKKLKSQGKRKRGKPIHLPMDNRKRGHFEADTQNNNHEISEESWRPHLLTNSAGHPDSRDLSEVLNRLHNHSYHPLQQQQQTRESIKLEPSSDDQQLCPKKMAEAVAFFLVRDLCPISVLAGEGFRTLMRKMAPTVRSPDVESMRRYILPKIYESAEVKLRTEFRQSDVTGASLSLEIWPRENKHYASIKVHYLDNHMRELKSKLLKTKEINAQVLCSELLMENYTSLDLTGISGPCPVVVNNPEPLLDELDNAVIPDIQEKFMVIPCLVSCLSDALKAGFNLPEVVNLVTRCQSLEDFEDSNSELNGEESWLVAYSKLRQMATAYPEIKQKYSQSVSYEDMLLSADEEELLEKLVPVIESINQTLETIDNGSLFMTASMIKPIICNLRKKQLSGTNGIGSSSDVIGTAHSPSSEIVNGSIGSTSGCNGGGTGFAAEIVSQFKAALWQHLCQFYQESGLVHNTLWIATLVDPRFKRSYESHAGNFEERAAIIKLLKDEVGESDSSMDSTDRPENSDLQQVFGQEYFSSASNSEVDRYLQEAPIRLKDNPLQWWSANYTNFPRVAEVARRYLCIPVTSVSTNRNFSTDDFPNSINAKRASIDPEDLDTYLFLSHNWQL